MTQHTQTNKTSMSTLTSKPTHKKGTSTNTNKTPFHITQTITDETPHTQTNTCTKEQLNQTEERKQHVQTQT